MAYENAWFILMSRERDHHKYNVCFGAIVIQRSMRVIVKLCIHDVLGEYILCACPRRIKLSPRLPIMCASFFHMNTHCFTKCAHIQRKRT